MLMDTPTQEGELESRQSREKLPMMPVHCSLSGTGPIRKHFIFEM